MMEAASTSETSQTSTNYTAQQRRRQPSSYSPPWELRICFIIVTVIIQYSLRAATAAAVYVGAAAVPPALGLNQLWTRPHSLLSKRLRRLVLFCLLPFLWAKIVPAFLFFFFGQCYENKRRQEK
jgi:hypothetical protein